LGAFYKRLKKMQNVPRALTGGAGGHDPDYIDMLSNPLRVVLEKLDRQESTRRLQILMVDDAAFMLKNVSTILSNSYKVYTLANPNMVEMFLEQIVPELFILDYKMPEMSGFDLVSIIRTKKEHKHTPIIFLTAEGSVETLSKAMKLGACDFLVKPYRIDVLQQRVANHITRKKTF
jgi:PleD family two-component response regulator